MIELEIECNLATTEEDMQRVNRLREALSNKSELMARVRKHLRLRPPLPSKVKQPTLRDRFNHTKNVNVSTEHFFTFGRNVPPECKRDVELEENPFALTTDLNFLQSVYQHKKKSRTTPQNCFVKRLCKDGCFCASPGTTVKRTCSEDECKVKKKGKDRCEGVNPIFARLEVPETPLPRGKVDDDPEYFRSLKGRPIKEKFNKSNFLKNQRKVFFQKLFARFFQDGVKKRQEHHRLDMAELERIDWELDQVRRSLETFVNQSHSESVKIVREQMEMSKLREAKEDELKRSKIQVGNIKNSLYKLDDVLSTSLNCRDLLLRLSPTDFRVEYEEDVKRNRPIMEKLVDQVVGLFDDYCRYNPSSEPDLFLDEVVHTFVKQLLSLGPPKIYFKHKWEIDFVFRKIELQCMDEMSDLSMVKGLQVEIDRLSEEIENYCNAQIDVVQQQIGEFEKSSTYQNRRSSELENAAGEIISTSFKEIASGDVVLETIALVEVLFDYIFGPSNAKFEPCNMMVLIEEELRKVDLQIQEIREKGFQIYEEQVDERMKNEIINANKAKEKDREIRAAIYRVKNLYTKPPVGPGWRRLVNRSEPLAPKKKLRADVLKEDKHFEHLQLDGICFREDVEDEIDQLVHKLVGPGTWEEEKPGFLSDGSSTLSSLRSSVHSESIEQAAASLFNEIIASEEESESSLSVIQLDYDSNEDLLVRNKGKRKLSGGAEPSEILYSTLNIDSKFMIHSKESKLAAKDKRHTHRIEPTVHLLGGL